MPVTLQTAKHSATRYHRKITPQDADSFFGQNFTFRTFAERSLGSTFNPDEDIEYIDEGLVGTVLTAYNGHHNLVIRPDDVWIAILSQLSFHINADAEALRTKFVPHENKKQLILSIPPSPLNSIDWDEAGKAMVDLMDNNLADKGLKNWIMPTFSTTTTKDKTVAAILMMASMQKYFDYVYEMGCGIPKVTLEGTKEDWESIQGRLEKLDTWDDTTRDWHDMLRPIIKKFIAAFDGEIDDQFWGHIISSEMYGSGGTMLISGWMTAFCAFSQSRKFKKGMGFDCEYSLDGVYYPSISSSDIPTGSGEVNVTITDNGSEHPCALVAGNMGLEIVSDPERDTIRNAPMWCCYLKNNMESS